MLIEFGGRDTVFGNVAPGLFGNECAIGLAEAEADMPNRAAIIWARSW